MSFNRHAQKIEIAVEDHSIGKAGSFTIMAGPCSVESRAQMDEVGACLKEMNIPIMRGGAFKPRTSPFSFQGLGEEGLRYMAETCEKYGLLSISEVMDTTTIELVAEYVDILQIGARNMHNYALLKEVGRVMKPIMLKRGFMSTVEELLLASEYIRQRHDRVLLCERGIRTFEPYTRNTLDLSCVALVQRLSPYCIIVDLSHALGRTDIILPMARSVVASGADGLMLEIHPDPQKALSDGKQSLSLEEFREFMLELRPWLEFRCSRELNTDDRS